MLQAHAAGVSTFATTLDLNDRSQVGVIDIDEGGIAALQEVLSELQLAGLCALAIALTTPGGHSGGHIWLLYDQFYNAGDIQAQLATIAPAGAEIWPCKQAIRLPFGVHRIADTRGQLLTQGGEWFNLDTADGLALGFAAIAALPRNAAPPLKSVPALAPQPTPLAPLSVQNCTPDARMDARTTIHAFNQANPLCDVLARYGVIRRDKGYSCPCGVAHTHNTTLIISRQGRLFSFSPRCRWHTDKGLDSCGLFCLVEHGNNTTEVLKAITPQRQSTTKHCIHHPADHPPTQLSRHRSYIQKSQAATTRAAVGERAAQDEELSRFAQLTIAALLDVAGERDWCRPSVPALAMLIGISERSVHSALRELEHYQYIESGERGGPGKTTIRRFSSPQRDRGTENQLFGLPQAQANVIELTSPAVFMSVKHNTSVIENQSVSSPQQRMDAMVILRIRRTAAPIEPTRLPFFDGTYRHTDEIDPACT
jgi:hypothetical protein